MADWKQGKIQFGFLETVTSGSTLTLTSSSLQYQVFTGTANHTVVLPNATTLVQGTGIAFSIVNVSTGTITVKLNDTTTALLTLAAGQGAAVYLTDNSTSNGVWVPKIGGSSVAAGIVALAPGSIKTSAYSVVSGDNSSIILVNTSAGAVNITLPSPAVGFKVTIKDIGGMAATNNVKILRSGSELIDNIATDTQIDENNMAISLETDGTNWTRIDSFHRFSIPTSGRGIFGGGNTGSQSAIIDYITISTAANALSFGNLTSAKQEVGACSSQIRGIFCGGGSISTPSNTIDYVTIATIGNGTNFGNLFQARNAPTGCSNSVRGVFAGGYNAGYQSTIDYITIPTTSNATNFGSATASRAYMGGCASNTRGVYAGGNNGSTEVTTIEYITISTTGNGTSFGNLTQGTAALAGCSNSITGLFAGGYNVGDTANYTTIEAVTISTTANATNFANLSSARNDLGGCTSQLRAVFAGGNGGLGTIDYIVITSGGTATSFGTLSVNRYGLAGCSSSHGGLNG